MADLFGLDIAGIINDEIAGSGGVLTGTLNKITPGTRTGGSLTDGTNPVITGHTFKGFVETREKRRKGQVSGDPVSVVTVLGASVSPAAVPEVNDSVILEGVTYTLTELLSRDPAAAVYEFHADA